MPAPWVITLKRLKDLCAGIELVGTDTTVKVEELFGQLANCCARGGVMAARSGARRGAACPRFAGRTLMVSTRPRACARSVLLPRWRKRTRSGSILRLCSKLPGPAAHKHAKSPHRSHRYRPHRAHPHHHGIKKKNILSTVFVNSSAARGSLQVSPYLP